MILLGAGSAAATLLRYVRDRITRPTVLNMKSKATIASFSSSSHHLERTKTKPRSQFPFWATIRKLWHITPTIRGIRLEIDYDNFYDEGQHNKDRVADNAIFKKDAVFHFDPGQWVDFFIPGTKMVGGYSIVSLPSALPMLDLAVKFSTHPPAEWITRTAKEGDRVGIKVGGDFVYDLPAERASTKLLLIAGGIGINPLYSILQHLLLVSSASKIILLYSAKSADELAFRAEIHRLSLSHPDSLRVSFAVTGADVLAKHVQHMKDGHCEVLQGRVSDELLTSSVEWLGGPEDVDVLVCGPPGMPESVQSRCVNVGISADRVRYEKWW